MERTEESGGGVPIWPYSQSYRTGPDSPDAASDGDSFDTFDHKERYWWLAAWGAVRWIRLVRMRRAARARVWRVRVSKLLLRRVRDEKVLRAALSYTVDPGWICFRCSERLEWMVRVPPWRADWMHKCPFLRRGGPPH